MFERYRSRSRDIQDLVERGMWGAVQHLPGAGSIMSVRGTGTVDEEVPVLNFGYGFNLPSDSNAEVVMTALGSDVNDKVAIPTLPRDKQHPWGEGEGGVQSPTDPGRRIEFNAQETWLRDGRYALGDNKEVTVVVAGGNVTINFSGDGRIETTGTLTLAAPTVAIESTGLTHNGTNIGDDHRHSEVQSGLDDTGEPI